jgi:hypothetical protein
MMNTQLQTQIKTASQPSFTPVQTGLLQRKCACGQHTIAGGECEECRQKRMGMMQRAAVNSGPVNGVPDSQSWSLGGTTRTSMGSNFGYDFSRVEVHANDAMTGDTTAASFGVPAAVRSELPVELESAAQKACLHNDRFAHWAAYALDLEAFTVGESIYFGDGRWQPETSKGAALLQHELGHVSRGEGRNGTIEGWSSQGHRTITLRALAGDSRYSEAAKMLLANTAPVPDYNRPQILQDMISFWAGGSLVRAPAGALGGAIVGSFTPPEQGTQIGGVRISGVLPQAVLGAGVIPTVPAEERIRGGQVRPELQRTRVTQELANHGEDLPERIQARTNEYINQGITTANRCDLYNGLAQLGYALHIAQDRGSHGDGYTASYVQGRPHREIDDMSLNPEGLSVALTHSREAIDSFFNGLIQLKRTALADPLALQVTMPPVAETLLGRPQEGRNIRSVMPGESGQPTGGINILSVRF